VTMAEPVPEPAADDDVIVIDVDGCSWFAQDGRWIPVGRPAYDPSVSQTWETVVDRYAPVRVYVPAARLAAAQQEIGRLTVRGRQEAAISDVMRDRALTAERRVARVQALCDDPGALYYGEDGELSALLANDVRAALDGTQ
jgi:hypothetical protein